MPSDGRREVSTIKVLIHRTRESADLPLPAYATPGSAGVDLRACIAQAIVLQPGGRALVGTGVAVALPEGAEAQIRPRSGLAAEHGVTLLNSPGTVDSDYRGEIRLVVINLGPDPYTIQRGDRIGQMVVGAVSRVDWEEVRELPATSRSAGGFGHTGKN